MTGVVKSARCGTCRDRKVKCDEVKPVCGPCQKGKRICKAPISKVKFARPKGLSAGVVHGSEGLIEPLSQISIVRSISTTEGCNFQTMRLGRRRRAPERMANPDADDHLPLLRRASLSPVQPLQLALLESFRLAHAGLRLSVLAGFMEDVPRMLGHSTAFDDSIACLVNCHNLILHGQRPAGNRKQGNLYAKALLSLQAALTDPVESYSDLTLGAVTILGNVEVFGGGSAIPQNVQHAGGACKLIEMRGPGRVKSDLAKILYMTQRAQGVSNQILKGTSDVVTVAMLRNEETFFNAPEWREISFTDVYDRDTDCIIDEVLREFTALPSLLVKIRAYYFSPDERKSYAIYLEVLRLRKSVGLVADFVDQKLTNGFDIVEGPPMFGDGFLPSTYQFSTMQLSHLCTFYWGLSIIINTIIARFLPANTPSSTLNGLQDQCLLARQRILMSCEYAQQFRPFGTMYLAAPLMMAYDGATPEEKTWIIHQLWQIGELMADVEVVWSRISVEYASKFFYGEPIVLPGGQASSDPLDMRGGAFIKRVQEQIERLSIDERVISREGRNG
ncbi:hypothetical protein SLS60_008359 [Paraconiothyrium brasiliense]|uniref:Zn(2)-C6 fungal-type domain-containing protein n=1 Tax=Paraconiothyrium brasiliense TaxID=300254 RepID=A0ABR3R0D7_9PLEO